MENEQSDKGYVSPEKRAEVAQKRALEDRRKIVGTSILLEESQEQDRVALANSNALVRLCNTYNLSIPQRDRDMWRPTKRQDGVVEGFEHFGEMTCLATDGLQAFFLRHDGSTWKGHIQFFQWTAKPAEEDEDQPAPKFGAPPPLFSMSKASSDKATSAKRVTKRSGKSAVERALEFLRGQHGQVKPD